MSQITQLCSWNSAVKCLSERLPVIILRKNNIEKKQKKYYFNEGYLLQMEQKISTEKQKV